MIESVPFLQGCGCWSPARAEPGHECSLPSGTRRSLSFPSLSICRRWLLPGCSPRPCPCCARSRSPNPQAGWRTEPDRRPSPFIRQNTEGCIHPFNIQFMYKLTWLLDRLFKWMTLEMFQTRAGRTVLTSLGLLLFLESDVPLDEQSPPAASELGTASWPFLPSSGSPFSLPSFLW